MQDAAITKVGPSATPYICQIQTGIPIHVIRGPKLNGSSMAGTQRALFHAYPTSNMFSRRSDHLLLSFVVYPNFFFIR